MEEFEGDASLQADVRDAVVDGHTASADFFFYFIAVGYGLSFKG